MTHDPLRHLIRSIGKLGESAGATITDAQLLERFVRSRDEAAFELLVWRHGPMVLGICRRLLADAHDADDAFQTTFLVLVRKAASIGRGAALAGWLYQVAYRVCIRLGMARAKQRAREQAGAEAVAAPVSEDGELLAVLDEEINRLPARQRVVFILCCLEGKTGAEAARMIGCAPGTVSSRLARARERLRLRLSRRGIAVPMAGVALGTGSDLLAAPVPPTLLAGTVHAAVQIAVGQTAGLSAATLAQVEGVLRAMFIIKLRKSAALGALLVVFLAGAVFAGQALLAQQPGAPAPQDAPPPLALQADAPKAAKQEAVGPVVVSVVKPQRGPLPRHSHQVCEVRAAEQVDLHAAVGGDLTTVSVDIGDKVKKGDVLAVIDDRLLELEVSQAQIAVQEAENLVREAEAGIKSAQALVDVANLVIQQRKSEAASAKAAADEAAARYERDKQLFAQKGIDARELSASQAAKDKFHADFLAKEAEINIAKAEVIVKEGRIAQAVAIQRTARGKVEAAQIGLAKARAMLARTRIIAPIDGVVTARNFSVGDLVRATDAAAIVTVQRTDLVRVIVHVPESEAAATDVGADVRLTFNSLPDVVLKGQKVARTGFVIEPASRTMRVEIDVANPQQLLRPGMSGAAMIHLRAGPSHALRVPLSAVVNVAPPGVPGGPGGPGVLGVPIGLRGPRGHGGAPGPGSPVESAVYVVRGGKAHRVRVELGQSSDNEIEILAGIRADDLVVTDPTILQGAAVPVEVKTAPAKK